MLTFETSAVMGGDNIIEKLSVSGSLPWVTGAGSRKAEPQIQSTPTGYRWGWQLSIFEEIRWADPGLCVVFLSQSLPFAKVKHQVATFDAQPSSEAGGILVMVTGALLVRIHTHTRLPIAGNN